MRNLSPFYCFNKSHILEEGTWSQPVDHVHWTILKNFCRRIGSTKGIARLGHYIITTRFLEPIVYKGRAPVYSSTCFMCPKKSLRDQSILSPILEWRSSSHLLMSIIQSLSVGLEIMEDNIGRLLGNAAKRWPIWRRTTCYRDWYYSVCLVYQLAVVWKGCKRWNFLRRIN